MRAILAVLALNLALAGILIPGAAAQDKDDVLGRLKGDAFVAGGLRAAARISGSYRQRMSPHGRNATTLRFLVDNSQLIVIGEIRGSRTWLNQRGDTITTDCSLAIERTLKGTVRSGDRLTVSILGGRVDFPEGTWAEIETPGMPRPSDHQVFILFLESSHFGPSDEEQSAAGGPIYTLAFESLGLYFIDGGTIVPGTYPHHPFAKKYAGQNEHLLVNDILDIVDRPTSK